jgi:hypothetical protein
MPITVSGSASDPGSPSTGVSLVQVQVNGTGGTWQTASGTTSWSASVSLSSGADTIYARSQDGAGNYSTIASVNVTFNAPFTRIISLSGDLTFGNVTVGELAQNLLTIANTGSSTLTVSNITYPNGFSGDWSGTIAGGGSRYVLVTFAPTSGGSYGGNVIVTSDATSGNNSIAVSGTGISTNPPPSLAANVQNNNLILSWATNAAGFTLEFTTNLGLSTVWNSIPTPPTVVNEQNIVTNPMVGQSGFFRLKK